MNVELCSVTKKTLILGASPNPERYAYRAAHLLKQHGHPIVPVGIKKGELAGELILNGKPELSGIDTVTLYLGPAHQQEYYDYLLSLKPKRIIMNPGTENPELEALAISAGIEVEAACTLVLLNTGQY